MATPNLLPSCTLLPSWNIDNDLIPGYIGTYQCCACKCQ
jgi:hypothetical protein